MAQYNPPSQNLPIFDSGLFGGTNSNPGSVPSGDFLNFPNAQGDENLLGITVADSATFNADSTFNDVVEINDDTTFSTNIIMSGTYLTNYIEFPDGSQQFSASGGTGDALLAGGSSSTPQSFTGYNNFSNADGQITLTNTTNSYSVNLQSDATTTGQLDIVGSCSVGGNITCDNINMGSQITLTNTVGSTPTSSTINQSSTDVETLVIDCNIQLSGGTNRYISLNYTGQPDITLEQNYPGNLLVSAPLELSPNLITYPGNTNTVAIYADSATENQLDILGNLNITGSFVGATSSGAPTIFTGFNQINGLITNGISCLQKIKGNVTYTSGQGSKWTFAIPTTYGFGFTFAFSTNFTPTAYTVVNNQVLTSQTNSCISGSGYASCQPYILSGTTYFAYLLGPIAFSGTTQLISQTTATTSGAVYTFQTNDNPNYYQSGNISMELYIYPQATI